MRSFISDGKPHFIMPLWLSKLLKQREEKKRTSLSQYSTVLDDNISHMMDANCSEPRFITSFGITDNGCTNKVFKNDLVALAALAECLHISAIYNRENIKRK